LRYGFEELRGSVESDPVALEYLDSEERWRELFKLEVKRQFKLEYRILPYKPQTYNARDRYP
jgi:hypothetical protein